VTVSKIVGSEGKNVKEATGGWLEYVPPSTCATKGGKVKINKKSINSVADRRRNCKSLPSPHYLLTYLLQNILLKLCEHNVSQKSLYASKS